MAQEEAELPHSLIVEKKYIVDRGQIETISACLFTYTSTQLFNMHVYNHACAPVHMYGGRRPFLDAVPPMIYFGFEMRPLIGLELVE